MESKKQQRVSEEKAVLGLGSVRCSKSFFVVKCSCLFQILI